MPTGAFARTKPSPIGPAERAPVAQPSVFFIVRFLAAEKEKFRPKTRTIAHTNAVVNAAAG